jgi:hypothetical protein
MRPNRELSRFARVYAVPEPSVRDLALGQGVKGDD